MTYYLTKLFLNYNETTYVILQYSINLKMNNYFQQLLTN